MDFYGRLLSHVLYPGWERLRGRPTFALLRDLQRTQWLTLDELRGRQAGLLRRLMRHAWDHNRFHRDRMDVAGVGPDDFKTSDDLARLPVCTREEMTKNRSALMSSAPPWPTVKKATSGTTGKPLVIEYNAESRHWREATKLRGYGWAGFKVGGRNLHYWAALMNAAPTRWKKAKMELDHLARRDHYVDCTPRGDARLQEVVGIISKSRPELILTYSQAGADLARYINRTGARAWSDIPVICGAERLLPPDRKELEQAFGPGIFETYGCREFMLIAAECAAHDGMHIDMEKLVVEILVTEPDGGMRPAQPGETGEVVVTDLHNLAMPFIRYVTGDLAVARVPDRCACGRQLPRIGPIEGRATDTLRDGNGNRVSGLIFNILFVEVATETRQFQAIQHIDGSLTLKVVPTGPKLTPEAREIIAAYGRKYLPGIDMRIEQVDDIPVSAMGKRRFVIVEKPPTPGAT